jgi:transposase
MDIWDPYVNPVRAHVTDADRKIVFDKLHVAQHLGKAVDEVRRKETGCATRRPWTRKTDGPSPLYARAN